MHALNHVDLLAHPPFPTIPFDLRKWMTNITRLQRPPTTLQGRLTALPTWLEHVEQGQHGSAARSFYERSGFAAWFSYSLVKHAADHQTSFADKAACKHIISRLNDTTAGYQRRLAAEVIGHLPRHDERRIKSLRKKLQHGQTQKMPPRQNRNKRQRVANDDSISPEPAPEPASVLSPIQAPSVREQATTHFTCDSLFFPHEDILVNASLESARKLFPEDLSNSIETLPQLNNQGKAIAALSMSFPRVSSDENPVCQMALEITHDRIQHFAMEWFGHRVEAKDGLRYLAGPDGTKIIPCPQFTLQGFRLEMLPQAFGQDIVDAIQKTPVYQDDVGRARLHTGSVSMIISHQQEATAHVYLSLALVEGTRIAMKLFELESETSRPI
ncbi:hypothetical protein CDV36_014808 [Fusarium kuroshium]|uniref:Uncharacterized protein n=1 Tax=Fusarium kuroshium TaxID=2010991 RepID=A0A3M2RES9_9HYPO|nr:hypothetical protein CDV36_014808 [Fusarium kuroshium]